MDWQPIETAPKDGTVILVWDAEAYFTRWTAYGKGLQRKGHVFMANWYIDPDIGGKWTEANDSYPANFGNPTHWMPLPEHP